MKVRGQAAFSISADERAGIVRMNAELLQGAQLKRSDRLIFSRTAQTEAGEERFKGSLKAMLDPRLADKYLGALDRTTAKVDSPNVSIAIASGRLQIDILATAADRESWIKARSGNRYLVMDFWLALEKQLPAFGAGIPPLGPTAYFSASLIFEAVPRS